MRTIVSALVLVLLWPITTAAAPGLVTYQGRLTDPSGSPASGPVAVEFRIYDAATGGTELWSESHAAVAVVAGLFKVELGANSEFDMLENGVIDGGDFALFVSGFQRGFPGPACGNPLGTPCP